MKDLHVECVYEAYISKTYYAQNLKINPESFRDHTTGDWYNQIKEVAGALCVGSVNFGLSGVFVRPPTWVFYLRC
jgi:hypothetical protein